MKLQYKSLAALAAAFCLINTQFAALAAPSNSVISPPVAGAADAMTIRKAFKLESDPLVSLVHHDASVESVLRGLAQKANLSLIFMVDGAGGSSSPSSASSAGEEDPLAQLQQDSAPAPVSGAPGMGTSTARLRIPYLELKNVPVSEAFALVLQMSGLTGRRVYNSLIISTPQRMTEMGFSSPIIKTYNIYNQAATMAVQSGGVGAGGASGGAAAGGAGAAASCMGGAMSASSTGQQQQQQQSQGPPIGSQLMCVFQSRGLIPQPRIMIDERTSTLTVIGTQEAIDIADQIVPILDRPLPQVVVEIKLIELSKNASNELGMSYGFGQEKTGAAFNTTTAGGPGNPVTGTGQGAITFNSLSRFAPNFNARLNALVRNRQARVLTSPRMTIQHGIKAIFDSTTQFPIVSSTATATTTTQTITSLNIGEQVEITPFIDTEKDMITMKLKPNLSTRGPIVTVGGQTIPELNRRTVETILSVADGDTVIIGGLMRKNSSENVDKIPLLGDIPVLGALFANTQKQQEEVEIVIMVTPHILNAE